jgi:hypothetical protein
MRLCSEASTTTLPRRLRLAFVVFLRIRWRANARLRFTFPVPVTLKRFLALEWVFILGMTKIYVLKNGAQKYGGGLKPQSFFELFI